MTKALAASTHQVCRGQGGTGRVDTKTQLHIPQCVKIFLEKKWWVDAQAHRTTATKNYAVCCPHMGTALPSQPPKCKGGQPDSGTACLVTVTTQPGMLSPKPPPASKCATHPCLPARAGQHCPYFCEKGQAKKRKKKRKEKKTPAKGFQKLVRCLHSSHWTGVIG